MKQLTPMDSHFFYFEAPNQPMMIGSLWLVDQSEVPGGLVRHKEVLQYISDRLNTTSYFRRRLQQVPFGLDDPYWLDDENFDLEYHVRHVGLPQPGDWRQLCIFTARTMARSVDMERAPWEVYIIEGVNNVEGMPPNSFAVLIRFHHAYVDGKSSLELSMALMETTPNHEYGRRDRIEVAERSPSPLEMWARTTPRMISQSYRSLKAGLLAGRKGAELLWRLQMDPDADRIRAPKTVFNAPVTPHRSYGGLVWSIPELKRMRQLCKGATVNDVIIAIVAGGMRSYLASHNALPASSLVAMCPVSIRPEEARKEGGNLISAMFISIGTEVADPANRLTAVHRRTAKGVPLAKEVLIDLTNAVGDMVPPYMRAFSGWLQNKTHVAGKFPFINTVITNVPGIPGLEPRYFAGARICQVFPLVPVCDGMGISHGITGIGGSVNLGVVADRKMVPDMDYYMSCIEASTQEYRNLLADFEAMTIDSAATSEASQPTSDAAQPSAVEPQLAMPSPDAATAQAGRDKVAASDARKPANGKRIRGASAKPAASRRTQTSV